jgi:hypothetical protein
MQASAYMLPIDYVSELRQTRLLQAANAGLVRSKTIVVFPKYIGTWRCWEKEYLQLKPSTRH